MDTDTKQILTSMENIHTVNMARLDDIQNQVDRLENKIDEVLTHREYMRQMSIGLQEMVCVLKETLNKIEVVQ